MSSLILVFAFSFVLLYFVIIYTGLAAAEKWAVRIFSNFTDACLSFIFTAMVIPFYLYAFYSGIFKFIIGYSFLFMLLLIYHIYFAMGENKPSLWKAAVSFFLRLSFLSLEALFLALSIYILYIYTGGLSVALKILWGVSLLGVTFLVIVIGTFKLASEKKFVSLSDLLRRKA